MVRIRPRSLFWVSARPVYVGLPSDLSIKGLIVEFPRISVPSEPIFDRGIAFRHLIPEATREMAAPIRRARQLVPNVSFL
jgi:hypothetical protein